MLLTPKDREEIREDLADLALTSFRAIQDSRIDEAEWGQILSKLAEVPPTKRLMSAAIDEIADLFYRDADELGLAILALDDDDIPAAQAEGNAKKGCPPEAQAGSPRPQAGR